MTKNQVLRAVSDKIPRPTSINELWQTDLTYILCGVDGWAYLFNVLDAYSREWVSYVFDPLAKKENAIQAVVKALENIQTPRRRSRSTATTGLNIRAEPSSSRWTPSASGTGS